MSVEVIDFYQSRLEELCCSFKQSMSMDHLPYPTAMTFKRYLGLLIDFYEKDSNLSPICYSLDLLRDLYVMNNPNLLFDLKQADLLSVEKLDDYKTGEQPIYGQTLSYYKIHCNSERFRLYVDFLQDINNYLTLRLARYGIELKNDFSAEIKIKAGVSISQIKSVVNLLQELGYIDCDTETANAFISIFEGSALAQQKMKIQWKCIFKTGDPGSTNQNIAALYVLFDTLGVNMENPYYRKYIEQIFLDHGYLKKRKMSDSLNRFKSQLEESLNKAHCEV